MQLQFKRGLYQQHGNYIAPVVETLTLDTAKLTKPSLVSTLVMLCKAEYQPTIESGQALAKMRVPGCPWIV